MNTPIVTPYWTVTNIANGLNALAICIEVRRLRPTKFVSHSSTFNKMVFFSALMCWAYTADEYARGEGKSPTGIWRPLWDSYVVCPPFHDLLLTPLQRNLE